MMESEKQEIGNNTLRFQSEDLKSYSLDQKVPILLVLRGTDTGLSIPLQKPETVLGRSQESDVVLHDEQISRRHILIHSELVHQKFSLVDLKSTNGTRVNLKEISECEIKDGDKIFLGSTVLKLTLQDELDIEHNNLLNRWIFKDDLTGLIVWRHFKGQMLFMLQNAHSKSQPLCLLMMDLDGLKKLNDVHGHDMGAFAIARIGKKIGEVVSEYGEACRFGGDEFIAYLQNHDLDSGLEVGGRICEAIRQCPIEKDGKRLFVSISIGIASFPDSANQFEDLYKAADEALYRAKAKGRNCVSA